MPISNYEDWKNQNFRGQDRRGEDFSGADLTNANFSEANLYKADFSGAKIQGANFHKSNLREANFSGVSVDSKRSYPTVNFSASDIRGADFTDATLPRADFTEARMGLNYLWTLCVVFVSVFLCLLSAFPTAIIGTFSLRFFSTSRRKISLITSIMIGVGAVITASCMRLFLANFPKIITQIHVGVGILMIILVLIGTLSSIISTESEDDFSGFALVLFVLISFLIFFLFNEALESFAETLISPLFQLINISLPREVGKGAFGAGVFGAVLGAVYGCWFSRSALSYDKRFSWLWKLYIRFVVIGGTLFDHADLTEACLAAANLQGANFKNANVTRTLWQRANSLECARVGSSYLKYPRIRQLILGKTVRNKNFDGLELTGINLESANLSNTSFVSANLNKAGLQKANLEHSNLQQAKLDGADLTGSKLTGACILNWTIGKTTLLRDVDCNYVFLENHPDQMAGRRRFPPLPKNFETGDFEKIYSRDKGQFQVLARSEDNKQALLNTIKQVTKGREYTFLGFEMIGHDDALIKFNVPKSTDAGVAQEDFLFTLQENIEKENQADPLKKISLQEVISKAIKMGAEVAGNRVINIGDHGAYNEHVAGNYAQRDYIDLSQNLSQAAAQIQDLLGQLRENGEQENEAQNIVAQNIAMEAKSNPTMKSKLLSWSQSLASSTVSDVVKGVVKLACQSAGIPL